MDLIMVFSILFQSQRPSFPLGVVLVGHSQDINVGPPAPWKAAPAQMSWGQHAVLLQAKDGTTAAPAFLPKITSPQVEILTQYSDLVNLILHLLWGGTVVSPPWRPSNQVPKTDSNIIEQPPKCFLQIHNIVDLDPFASQTHRGEIGTAMWPRTGTQQEVDISWVTY